MNITIRLATADDVARLEAARSGVFDGPVLTALVKEFLADPRHHLAIALDGDEIVGFVSAVHYMHPDKPSELWINEVGVAESHQRQGIGQRLLQRMLDHARSLDCRNAWVLTDPGNAGACRLYASVPGAKAPSTSLMFEFALEADGTCS